MEGTMAGRIVPRLEEFTFPDTGITVRIRKFSPSLRDDIDAALRRQYPVPDPPMQAPVEGFGEQAPQPNPLDPEYRERVAAWQLAHMARLSDKLLRVAIAQYVEVPDENDMAGAVADLRDRMAPLGVELTDDAQYLYITRIAIGSREDLRDFETAIFTRSKPSRDEVDSIKATFRGDVQG